MRDFCRRSNFTIPIYTFLRRAIKSAKLQKKGFWPNLRVKRVRVKRAFWNTLVCSPSADSVSAAGAAIFGCQHPQHPLQSGDNSHVERKWNEEVGERCGSRQTIESTQALCWLLPFGKHKVRHWVPEGWKKSQNKTGCKPGESEMGSQVLHLFRLKMMLILVDDN